MTIIEKKKKIRKEMSLKRVEMDLHVKAHFDQWICDSLWEVIVEKNYKTVHCYLPMGTEINIQPLIEKMLANRVSVVTPKTLPNSQLQNLVLSSLNELEQGVFGTTHPANAMEYLGSYDLIIVPGLAFDSNRFRLGYGGGYYDNFLLQNPNAYKLGIFYPFQKVKQVPLESHDLQLDDILIPML